MSSRSCSDFGSGLRLERLLFALAGSVTLASVLLGVSSVPGFDALLVRLVLVPVLLRLLGRAAWARPRWLRMVPEVRFSHN